MWAARHELTCLQTPSGMQLRQGSVRMDALSEQSCLFDINFELACMTEEGHVDYSSIDLNGSMDQGLNYT